MRLAGPTATDGRPHSPAVGSVVLIEPLQPGMPPFWTLAVPGLKMAQVEPWARGLV